MSLLRMGRNPDGTRHIVKEGPARARVAGYGGSLISHAVTPIRPQPRSAVPLREKDRRRKERRERLICGIPLSSNQNARLNGEPCARMPGHVEAHRSKASMEHAAGRRRSGHRTVAA